MASKAKQFLEFKDTLVNQRGRFLLLSMMAECFHGKIQTINFHCKTWIQILRCNSFAYGTFDDPVVDVACLK